MFTDTPDPILAVLTDEARTNFAQMTLGLKSFKVKGFAVGRGGYNDTNPVKIISVDGSSSSLIDQFFPTTGIKLIEAIEMPTPSTIVANCRVARDESISALGEIGLWAEIVYSNAISEIGTTFLMAVAHFPIVTKTYRQVILYRVIIQF